MIFCIPFPKKKEKDIEYYQNPLLGYFNDVINMKLMIGR